MTNDEAIKWFQQSAFYHEKHEPFNMAIKALSQQTEDAISRQAVIKEVYKMPNYAFATVDVLEIIEQLPPVTPKQETAHWKWLRSDVVMCDKCGYVQTLVDFDEDKRGKNYCPSCGRKMEE